jgi:DNA-directed RNA polymerase subunit RPC12/RpoP
MTVKIISHGEQEVRRLVCERCGSVLEFARTDVQSEPQYNEDDDYAGERRWIDCPKCNSQAIVKE